MLSKGEMLLREYVSLIFPQNKVLYNYRPDWLGGLEIDVFLPEIGVGFEFNGDQHYTVTEFGPADAQRKRDYRKKKLCIRENVVLVTVQAIDLEYRHLRRSIGARRPGVDRVFLPPMTGETKGKLKALNKRAMDYRKSLIKRHNSPTARAKGRQARKDAFAARRPELKAES